MKKSLAIVALTGAMILAGCSDEAKPDASVEPPNRMQNPEYLAKLKVLEQEQKTVMRECALAEEALAKANEEGAGEERIAELEAALEAARKSFLEYQERARKTVRDQIWSDLNAQEKQSKHQKGK